VSKQIGRQNDLAWSKYMAVGNASRACLPAKC